MLALLLSNEIRIQNLITPSSSAAITSASLSSYVRAYAVCMHINGRMTTSVECTDSDDKKILSVFWVSHRLYRHHHETLCFDAFFLQRNLDIPKILTPYLLASKISLYGTGNDATTKKLFNDSTTLIQQPLWWALAAYELNYIFLLTEWTQIP